MPKAMRTRILVALLALVAMVSGAPAAAQTTPPKFLALYDAPAGTEWEKLGPAYAIMLRNLLGHFDAQVELLPVQQYSAGQVNYAATFYLGAAYDHQLPPAFLSDAATTSRTLVWFKYNLWQLAWNPGTTSAPPVASSSTDCAA